MVDTVEDAIEAAAGDWLFQGALLAIRQLAKSGHGFTAENVTALIGDLSASQHLGLAFALAERKGYIEQVGARIGSRGRPLRIWWGRT